MSISPSAVARGVASWPEQEQVAFGDQLQALGAVLFGVERDGGHTARARADLAPVIASGKVLYVPCDAGEAQKAACASAGVRMTPTLVAGGQRVEGYPGLAAVVEVVEAPRKVSTMLSSRGAVLYGRDSCSWTRRQKAALGVHAAAVPYVNCDEEQPARKGAQAGADACKAAGVAAVPTWVLDGVALPGYQALPALGAMASTPVEQLRKRAAEVNASLQGGAKGATC